MDVASNSEGLRQGEHELFVSRVRYQVAKKGIEVCATYIQEELEGNVSIDNLEKYMEEYEIWSNELICTHRNLVDSVPRGEFKSIVRDCINFCRLHKKMVFTARRLIKEGQPQHAHTHTEEGTRVEKVSVLENVRNISRDISDEKRIHGSVNQVNEQTVDKESPTQRMLEMQGSWGDNVGLPVSGTVAESDGIDTSAAELSSIVESTRLEELAVVPQITAPVPSPRSSLLGTQCMQHADHRESAGLKNFVRACVSPGVTNVKESASSSAIEQLQVQMQHRLRHQQQLLQQQQVIPLQPQQQQMQQHQQLVNDLGDGRGNGTRISHMATLLGVDEVKIAALLVLVCTAYAAVGVPPAAKQHLHPHHAADIERGKDNYLKHSKFRLLGWELEKVSESTEMEVECKNEFLNRNCYKGKSWHLPDGLVLITSLLPHFTCVLDDRRRSTLLD